MPRWKMTYDVGIYNFQNVAQNFRIVDWYFVEIELEPRPNCLLGVSLVGKTIPGTIHLYILCSGPSCQYWHRAHCLVKHVSTFIMPTCMKTIRNCRGMKRVGNLSTVLTRDTAHNSPILWYSLENHHNFGKRSSSSASILTITTCLLWKCETMMSATIVSANQN